MKRTFSAVLVASLVAPFAAGGVNDTSARAAADPLLARLGLRVVVER